MPPLADDERTTKARSISNDSDKPMISGQLLIFELDEEPPEVEGRTESGETGPSAHFAPLLLLLNGFLGSSSSSSSSTSSSRSCAISRGGLLAVAGGLGAVCAALFIAVLSMFIRLSRVDGTVVSSLILTQQIADRCIPGKSSESSFSYAKNSDRFTAFRSPSRQHS